jgi:hypothetical protein
MIMAVENRVLGEKNTLSPFRFVHYQSHMDWFETEPALPR